MKKDHIPERVDSAQRLIRADRETVYAAFIDPRAIISWLPPEGMTAKIGRFDPVPGGAFELTLTYHSAEEEFGKTTADTDQVQGTFVELLRPKRIVWAVTFQSDDPQYAGEMIQTWRFDETLEGTLVTLTAEQVPPGIGPEDHEAAFRSTLENLARYVQGPEPAS